MPTILVAGGLRCAESRHGRTAAAGADQAVGSSHDDLHCGPGGSIVEWNLIDLQLGVPWDGRVQS